MAEAASSSQEVVNIGIKELLDAGMHFGHQSKRWNPKMKRFIFGKRNGIYIIDLTKTLAQLKQAQQFVYEAAAQGRGILFVGTKKQAQEAVKEAAIRCGQHYVNNRWLGGTLTNNRNIRVSIKRMQEIEALEQKGAMENMPMKEVSRLRHELERHQRFLSGLAKMDSMPGAMVVIDVNRETIAVKEANRMGIPVVATVDTNCDPDPIAYPIPGNDDSSRAVRLVLNVIADVPLSRLPPNMPRAPPSARRHELSGPGEALRAALPTPHPARTPNRNKRGRTRAAGAKGSAAGTAGRGAAPPAGVSRGRRKPGPKNHPPKPRPSRTPSLTPQRRRRRRQRPRRQNRPVDPGAGRP